MSGLEKIQEYFQEFRDSINRCKTEGFQRANFIDAYNRLARLKDRYEAENDNLTAGQQKALFKVFKDDPFIEGMLHARQIGEHVTKRSGPGPITRTAGNAAIKLDLETSAMAYFADRTVTVPDVNGEPHTVDHLAQLRVAETRVGAALERALLSTT
jgi:hypothetical protein